jgi:phage head maturation protease
MPRLEYKSMAFEVKSSNDDGSEFTGVGAAFNSIDYRPDIIHPNAYDKHLDEFRRNGVVRDEHEVTTGKIVDATIEPTNGLVVKGQISATSHGMDQRRLLKDGVYKNLSIGHYVLARTYLDSPEEVQAYWDTVGYRPTDDEKIRSAYGARLITEAQPKEVSTTFLPMNPNAKIREVKSNGTAPVRGLTFDDHSESTLAALEEYHERALKLMEKRGADGRTLSKKHQAAFQRLSDRLLSLLDAMKDPETKTQPADAPTVAAEANSLYAEFLATWSQGG